MQPKTKKAFKELGQIIKWDIGALVLLFLLVNILVDNVKYNDVKDVVGTLQNISASIFTIVGLWVGFLYPNAIQSIVSDNVDYIKNSKDVPRIEKLIYVIVISALVMLGTLIFYIAKSILGNTLLYAEYKDIFKVIAFTFAYFLCWLQGRCIMSVIISNLRFANNLHSKINSSRIEHDE
jgi:hypothetical protein